MHDLQFFVVECSQECAEWVPILPQEDVDGYEMVALPPPGVGKIKITAFEHRIRDSAKVINGGYVVVAVLHYANVFVARVQYEADKWVFLA